MMRRRCSIVARVRRTSAARGDSQAGEPTSTRGRCGSPRTCLWQAQRLLELRSPSATSPTSRRGDRGDPARARRVRGARRRPRAGEALRSLAQMLWSAGRPDEAETAARSAVASLEQLPQGRELAMAYAVLASRCMNAEDTEEASTWGTRALGLPSGSASRRSSRTRSTLGTTRSPAGAGWSADARSKPRSRGA